MARTSSQILTSQFFINLRDNEFDKVNAADGVGYCVFGRLLREWKLLNNRSSSTGTQAF